MNKQSNLQISSKPMDLPLPNQKGHKIQKLNLSLLQQQKNIQPANNYQINKYEEDDKTLTSYQIGEQSNMDILSNEFQKIIQLLQQKEIECQHWISQY